MVEEERKDKYIYNGNVKWKELGIFTARNQVTIMKKFNSQ